MIVVHILTSMITVSFAVTILSIQLMSNVVFRCVCLIVCVTLGPKAVISRGGDKIAMAGGGVHFLRRGW